MQCNIENEIILWKEASELLRSRRHWNGTDQYPTYARGLGGALYRNLSVVVSDAEKKMYHSVINDCGKVGNIEEGNSDGEAIECFDCKRSRFFLHKCVSTLNTIQTHSAYIIPKKWARHAIFQGIMKSFFAD